MKQYRQKVLVEAERIRFIARSVGATNIVVGLMNDTEIAFPANWEIAHDAFPGGYLIKYPGGKFGFLTYDEFQKHYVENAGQCEQAPQAKVSLSINVDRTEKRIVIDFGKNIYWLAMNQEMTDEFLIAMNDARKQISDVPATNYQNN